MGLGLRIGMWSLALALVAADAAAVDAKFAWPDGKKAAVSLAYDDALDSQLDNAIPALDRHGLKGSFYLQLSRETVLRRMTEWRAAARNGHELGNHSLFHQCSRSQSGRDWVEPQRDLDTTTVAQMRDQVVLGNAMLHAIDGATERTYTAPCVERMARDGDYVAAIADQFVGIKIGGNAIVPDMRTLNPLAVPIGGPVDVTGEQLIAQVEEAARQGTMVNFTFHGIGGDYLTVSNEAHEKLLAYLDARRDIYWTDTFVNLMRWVRKQQAEPAKAP